MEKIDTTKIKKEYPNSNSTFLELSEKINEIIEEVNDIAKTLKAMYKNIPD